MRPLLVWIPAALLAAPAPPSQEGPSVFSRGNLVAWCIVPFDAAGRGPEQRAGMLKRLGITRLAYDWREKDIPSFDAEAAALARHGIRLHAFWLTSGPAPESQKSVQTVLDFLKRRGRGTEIWYMFVPPKDFAALTQEAKVEMVSRAAGYLASEAEQFGSRVGLYNHGGWFGEPDNQIAVINRLGRKNVGIVYNFHHGREQMDRFAELFGRMLPYLMAVNLNGMRAGGAMILPLGEGDRELGMLRVIRESGYRGPIGILGHRPEMDVEVSLRQNLDGLRKLLAQLGDQAALRTYETVP